jgi:hypothetical protein
MQQRVTGMVGLSVRKFFYAMLEIDGFDPAEFAEWRFCAEDSDDDSA